jgi:predicted ATPase
VGKTRIAVATGRELLDTYADGVWFVDLAHITQPALVPQTIAQAIGLRAEPTDDIGAVLKLVLRGKHALLIVDNCEHLIESTAQLIYELLDACPNVRVLATSREPASSVDPQFSLSTDNAAHVVQICRHLDGIPLAIELAAARVNVLTCEQIASRLDARLGLLKTGNHLVAARHQSLSASIDWSYDLLTEPEQKLFRTLSAFPGGCALQALESVCDRTDIAPDTVIDLLGRLIAKSLVVVDDHSSERRYRLLETLRQYAEEKVVACGEAQAIERAQAEYYVPLLEAVSLAEGTHWDRWWGKRIERDYDNVRSLLQRFCAQGDPDRTGLRIVGALVLYWWTRGHWIEGREWARLFLSLPSAQTSTSERALAQISSGALDMYLGNLTNAEAAFQQSLELSNEIGFSVGTMLATGELAMIAYFSGAWLQCSKLCAEVLPLAERLGRPWPLAVLKALSGLALANLGRVEEGGHLIGEARQIAVDTGDISLLSGVVGFQASFARLTSNDAPIRDLYREAIELCREAGHPGDVAHSLSRLADFESQYGNVDAAAALASEAITHYLRVGSRRVTSAFVPLIAVALSNRRLTEAVYLLATIDTLNASARSHLHVIFRPTYERCLAAARSQLEPEVFQDLWSVGCSMDLDHAIQVATECAGPVS